MVVDIPNFGCLLVDYVLDDLDILVIQCAVIVGIGKRVVLYLFPLGNVSLDKIKVCSIDGVVLVDVSEDLQSSAFKDTLLGIVSVVAGEGVDTDTCSDEGDNRYDGNNCFRVYSNTSLYADFSTNI